MYGKTEESDKAAVDRLEAIAKERSLPVGQIALAWMLSKPGITSPNVGASKPHHLEDAVAALDLKLSAEEIEPPEEPYVRRPTLGFS